VSNLKSVALTVLELLALTPIDRPLRTDRQDTHIERTHLRHSLRSLGGDNDDDDDDYLQIKNILAYLSVLKYISQNSVKFCRFLATVFNCFLTAFQKVVDRARP